MSPAPLLPLLSDGVLSGSRSVPSAVLVALVDEEGRAGQRGGRAMPCGAETSPARWPPAPQRFGKQIRTAERRGIPFVWFLQADGTHQVKDIRSGDQVDADPGSWLPPEKDLRPTEVSTLHDPGARPVPDPEETPL